VFVGVGFEGNAIAMTEPGLPSVTENGRGFGFLIGYGFNRRASLYGQISAASIGYAGGFGSYAMAHVDIGTRIHFLSGPGRVVPFLQLGLSSRAIRGNFLFSDGLYTIDAAGAGFGFGVGLNAHFTPVTAFSAAVSWSGGDFSQYKIDNIEVTGSPFSALSARVHLGLVWFPHAP
jgi:hypothetical protein